ncbi:hypothetical protein LXA43DRAFT_434540 [Ganoderma leucocontextum]|nr:hypothetical protein LXA43DRAFT_434540 [Ganoderma leucocontextum]
MLSIVHPKQGVPQWWIWRMLSQLEKSEKPDLGSRIVPRHTGFLAVDGLSCFARLSQALSRVSTSTVVTCHSKPFSQVISAWIHPVRRSSTPLFCPRADFPHPAFDAHVLIPRKPQTCLEQRSPRLHVVHVLRIALSARISPLSSARWLVYFSRLPRRLPWTASPHRSPPLPGLPVSLTKRLHESLIAPARLPTELALIFVVRRRGGALHNRYPRTQTGSGLPPSLGPRRRLLRAPPDYMIIPLS